MDDSGMTGEGEVWLAARVVLNRLEGRVPARVAARAVALVAGAETPPATAPNHPGQTEPTGRG